MRNKLAHSVWECKYHIVWIPKYRRKVVYGQNFRGHHFWARGYYVSTVGLDEAKVRNYIKNQEEADRLGDSGSSSGDPFQQKSSPILGQPSSNCKVTMLTGSLTVF